MTIFENSTADVRDVLNFIEGRGVLSGTFDASRVALVIRTITSLVDIDSYRDPDYPNALIEGNMNWLDIKAVDETLLTSEWTEEFESEIWPRIEFIRPHLWDQLSADLGQVLPEYEIEEILEFMLHLIALRSASGITDSFNEELFSVYKAGGYPCGWSGSYPEGCLVVFSREV